MIAFRFNISFVNSSLLMVQELQTHHSLQDEEECWILGNIAASVIPDTYQNC